MRLLVLASGSGNNFQALVDAARNGSIALDIAALISDKPEAYALTRARRMGIEACAFPKKAGEERSDYDRRLADKAAAYKPDYIFMLGWMRLLSNVFLERFPNKVVNLHPALPGMFPGTHAIERAYSAFQNGTIQASGCMTHFVPDEGVDSGPVIATQALDMRPRETLAEFEARMHKAEHALVIRSAHILLLRS